jgi:DNA ligase (NAD+)
MQNNEQLYIRAKEAYYAGEPIMSDSDFDLLEAELKNAGSEVVNIVGAGAVGKIPHLSPMLSLSKISVYDNENLPMEDFKKWIDTCKGSTTFEFTSKMDGNAVNLIYKRGRLKHAITRGEGHRGYDVVDKLKHIVPHTISNEDDAVEIRGEVVIKVSTFNEKYSDFKNPRNFVAGILNRDETDLNIVKDLDFASFEARIHSDDTFNFPENTRQFLISNGFNYPESRTLSAVSDFEEIYKHFLNFRENLAAHQLDGIVIKAHETIREEIGYTDHHPKWAIAIKFPPKDAITEIVDIQWKTGTSGEIVPTAIMRPIDLDGSTVSRATLFNWGRVRDWKAYPGAQVLIAKAGDIIPQIYQVIKPSDQEVKPPSECPSCGGHARIDDLHIWCDNRECYTRVISQLTIAIKIFKAENIGQSTVEKFYEAGFKKVTHLFDREIFNRENLIKTGFFKDGRQLEIILEAMHGIEEVTLSQVILACQYDQIGNAAAEKLALYFSGQDADFSGLNRSALNNVIGDPSLMNELIETFERSGVKVTRPVLEVVDAAMTFEMTGSPKDFGFSAKNDFLKLAADAGFKHTKLEKGTRYLITDSMESSSSKMQKATKVGTEIITYGDFIKKHCTK